MPTSSRTPITTVPTHVDEQSCTAVSTDEKVIEAVLSTTSTGEDGDEVLEQECLHDTQAEMEHMGSILDVLSSSAHVKRYVMASDDKKDISLISCVRYKTCYVVRGARNRSEIR